MQITLLLSVLALAAIAAAQTDCPEPVECVVNPCDVERCPRFLNAVCVPNTCDGSCTANFFRGRNNRNNVTDRCPIETCNEKQCPGNRFCVEERVPAECPQGNPRCRQHIEAKCVLPTDCSQITCDDPEEICIVRNSRPRCVDPSRIRECRERDCESSPGGLQCRQVIAGFEFFVCQTPPRCTAARVEFCEATSNRTCIEFEGDTACTASCEQLGCERFGQECVRRRDGGFTCAPPATCTVSLVEFCEQTLRECQESNGTASCVATCNTLQCESVGQECVMATDGSVSCEVPVTCIDALVSFCRQFSLECQEFNGTARCITTCETLQCESFGQECVMGNDGRFSCEIPTTCTPAREAFCAQFSTVCAESNGTTSCAITCATLQCESFGFICNDTGPEPFCMVPTDIPISCDAVECDPGSNCFVITAEGIGTNVPTCIPGIGRTCEDVICTGNTPACLLTELPDRDFQITQCFIDIDFQPPTSLNNCSTDPCNPVETCVDLEQRGIVVSFFCATTGCITDLDCGFGRECVNEPSIGLGVCVPDDVSYDPNINDCSNRPDCMSNSGSGSGSASDGFGGGDGICNAVLLDGEPFGTICTTEVTIIAASCEGLGECAEGTECTLSTLNDSTVAQCFDSATLDQAFSPFGV